MRGGGGREKWREDGVRGRRERSEGRQEWGGEGVKGEPPRHSDWVRDICTGVMTGHVPKLTLYF